MDLLEIMQKKLGTILDVRSPGEFQGGNVAGSLNIPLQEIPARLEEIKNLPAPLVCCCASGNRSGQALQFLEQKGISCINGGSWNNLHFLSLQKN